MNTERTALAHQPIEQHRRILRELVILGKEFLKLVDHQQRAGHTRVQRSGFRVQRRILS